jgi:hypothetical protein
MQARLGSSHQEDDMQRDDRDVQRGAGTAPIDRDTYPGHDESVVADLGLDPLAPSDDLRDVEQERARLYPGGMAGVEPLQGHVVEPDAVETAVEDALVKERAGWEGARQLDTRPARLGGADGLGVMRVVRSADGVAVSMPGTWRPAVGDAASAQGFAAGAVLHYEGPLHRGDGTVEEVSQEVRVTSAGRYVTEDGEDYFIVNFEAVGVPQPARP